MNNYLCVLYTMPERSRQSRSRQSRSRQQKQMQLQGGGTPIAGYVTPTVSGLTPFSGGDGCSARLGGSALSDIAIPAVFIAANQIVGRKRSMGKSAKRRRGSRRVRFSRRRR
jgi:hypothetical protein